MSRSLFALLVLVLAVSCKEWFGKGPQGEPLARVGEVYLYKAEVLPLLDKGMSSQDSAAFVSNYVNTWAAKQLMLSKARINLPQERMQNYDRLAENYRAELYTQAYKEGLVNRSLDTLVSDTMLLEFYEREKENFKLREPLFRLRYVELPLAFSDVDDVRERIDRFNEEDKVYLDSMGVHFKRLHFNDSIWVPISKLQVEILPLILENQRENLKKSQLFELQDSLGVYLGKVVDELASNEIAPLSYIQPTLEQVLLNRRRLDYIRKLEVDIIDEAVRKKEFEVYENQ